MAIHKNAQIYKATSKTNRTIEITVLLLMYKMFLPKQRIVSDVKITKEMFVKYHLCSINTLSTSCYSDAPCMFNVLLIYALAPKISQISLSSDHGDGTGNS